MVCLLGVYCFFFILLDEGKIVFLNLSPDFSYLFHKHVMEPTLL